MRVMEEFNYNEKKFREESRFTTRNNIKNDFINEEMILLPLYKKIKIDNKTKIHNFFPYNNVRVECYCHICKKRRIFIFEDSKVALNSLIQQASVGSATGGSSNSDKNQIEDLFLDTDFFTFCAQADCNHKMIIQFMKIDTQSIMKIGQFPSIYDLNEEINNKSFLKLLGKEYSDYYKKACSLYSFDTYIGALIYLRRIFEKLLIDVFNENADKLEISFDEFKNKKMEEKINTLKDYLPTIMFNQGFNNIYSKISNGIHNLTEEECYNMFFPIKMGIEEILTEKVENDEKLKRIKKLEKELQNV